MGFLQVPYSDQPRVKGLSASSMSNGGDLGRWKLGGSGDIPPLKLASIITHLLSNCHLWDKIAHIKNRKRVCLLPTTQWLQGVMGY